MKREIKIRNRAIGEGKPIFIMAECGVTCNYDMKIAKKLIDVVEDSGADAIKFAFLFPEEIMSDKTIIYEYNTINGRKKENMYNMLNNLRFSLDEWRELKSYADEKEVILLSSVASPSGIKYAEILGLDAYKLSSWDYNYIPFFRKIAKIGKPMLIDTGPVNTLDVAKIMKIMKDAGNDQSILVHCYHTKNYDEMNMRAIPYMRQAFNTHVGFSAIDHRDEQDIIAVALGAVLLEKRLTLKRDLPGHHQILCKEPKEFKEYVSLMRKVQYALGEYDLKPSQTDLDERKKWFRHIVANKDIPSGTVLSAEMMEGKRPEEGVSPEYMSIFVGKKTKRDLKYNEAIDWNDI